MSKKSFGNSIIPMIDGRALDVLKGIAAVLMVIDHMNARWFKGDILEMALTGRVVFPVFCYAIAVGLLRGDTKKQHDKYLASLLVLGLISEPLLQIARHEASLNVIFTLAFGVFFAGLARRMKDWQLCLCYAAGAAASMLLVIPVEFGLSGVMLPSAILLVMQGKRRFLPFLLLLLFTINAPGLREAVAELPAVDFWSRDVMQMAMLLGLFASIMPYLLITMARELPQTGRYLSRYSLHVFYPGHQLLIWALGLHFFP